MAWDTANKPKVSNKLGIPNPKEGGDGDIQVRQTGIGARLFAKLSGRWFSAKLFGNEIDDPNIFIPKCWTTDVVLPGDKGNTLLTVMPGYITKENILAGIVTIFDDDNTILSPLFFTSAGEATAYECVFFISPTAGENLIKCIKVGTTLQSNKARITIFFK